VLNVNVINVFLCRQYCASLLPTQLLSAQIVPQQSTLSEMPMYVDSTFKRYSQLRDIVQVGSFLGFEKACFSRCTQRPAQ